MRDSIAYPSGVHTHLDVDRYGRAVFVVIVPDEPRTDAHRDDIKRVARALSEWADQ